jgi:hypothetical protein
VINSRSSPITMAWKRRTPLVRPVDAMMGPP